MDDLESLLDLIYEGKIEVKAEGACPSATKDVKVNLKNRQNAIDNAGYGPLNPNQANNEFWKKKADRWDVRPSDAKGQICGNCAAFIKTPRMLDCIEAGLGNEEGNAAWDVIEAGDIGYCEAFDFKCASKRTCDAWIVGGPITEEKAKQETKSDELFDENEIKQYEVDQFLNSLSDDELDALFPEGEEISSEEEKWLFDTAGGYLRRALTGRRKKRRKRRKEETGEMEEKAALRDPKGGLTAAGRAFYKRTEGSNLKPGVRGPADTPQKMRRKGSFLVRFFSNPRGPMKDDKGRPTRLALSAAAWGEPVPQNMESAKKLAEKGRRLLERYRRYQESQKKKSIEIESEIEIKELGRTIGQSSGTRTRGSGRGNYNVSARDADGDGVLQEGTDYERPAPKNNGDKKYETSYGSADVRERGKIREALTEAGFDAESFGELMKAEIQKLKPGQKTNWNPGRLPNGGKIAGDGTYIPPDMVREDDKKASSYYRGKRKGNGKPKSSAPKSTPKKETADTAERRIEAEEVKRTGKGKGFDKIESQADMDAYRGSQGLDPVPFKKPKPPRRSGTVDSIEKRNKRSNKPLY